MSTYHLTADPFIPKPKLCQLWEQVWINSWLTEAALDIQRWPGPHIYIINHKFSQQCVSIVSWATIKHYLINLRPLRQQKHVRMYLVCEICKFQKVLDIFTKNASDILGGCLARNTT